MASNKLKDGRTFETVQQAINANACTPATETKTFLTSCIVNLDFNRWGMLLTIEIEGIEHKFNCKSISHPIDANSIEVIYYP